MTKIHFYFNVTNKHELMMDLIHQRIAKRREVTVMTEDEQTAQRLSQDIWQAQGTGFLPHVLSTHPLALSTPVHICWQHSTPVQDDMLINCTQEEPRMFSRFKHLVELVCNEEADKLSARARYKLYRDRGYEILNTDCANPAQTHLSKSRGNFGG